MTDLPAAAEQYLAALEAALGGVPASARASILDDVRAHLSDAAADGRDIDATLAALGSPESVARDARDQLGVPAASDIDPAARAGRCLHWTALAVAVVTAMFVSFLLPLFSATIGTVDSAGTESLEYASATLFEEMGLGIGLLPLLPAVLVLLPLVLPQRLRATAGWTVAAVMTVFSVIAGFTIGGFYIPVTLILWAAMLVPSWIRRGRNAATGRTWRIIGAVVMFAPACYAFSGLITGSLRDGGVPFWVTAFVVLLLAVLFGCRVPFIDVVVAVLGAAVMLLAIFGGGMLILALWWAGGLWLAIGLCGIAARLGTGTRR